ncbi:hypothetical protein [Candidatus Soleaferrea massiliensis]|uniref:hypothetical protein n=1 Tax=Candidatus Soleaferrea massiliensis TaxID=1470354 RepID=UPI0012DFF3E8|nr:hypothetical protein [Candidatus Soleaferrea massiliensis]
MKIPSDIPLSVSAVCGQHLALDRVDEWLAADVYVPYDSFYLYPDSRIGCVNDFLTREQRNDCSVSGGAGSGFIGAFCLIDRSPLCYGVVFFVKSSHSIWKTYTDTQAMAKNTLIHNDLRNKTRCYQPVLIQQQSYHIPMENMINSMFTDSILQIL